MERELEHLKEKVKHEHIEATGNCGICLGDFTNEDEVIALGCGKTHIFHFYCFCKWISLNDKCPYCRELFDPKASIATCPDTPGPEVRLNGGFSDNV